MDGSPEKEVIKEREKKIPPHTVNFSKCPRVPTDC